MSHGWVVYSRPDGSGTLQLWSRSPGGAVRPVTTGGFGTVESLGPAGEVVYTDRANSRRFVEVPPYTAPPVDAGGTAAILRWKGADLYAFYGRTAFRVVY